MKRRLDLASALVHQPRGALPRRAHHRPRPQPPADASGRRCAASTPTGTTIFLTTQYLEEADELCERLAIIDHGELVAEGTPESLKAEIGKDVVSVELHGADAERTREVIGELPGLDRVIAGAGRARSLRRGRRRLDRRDRPPAGRGRTSRSGRSRSRGRRWTTSSWRRPGGASRERSWSMSTSTRPQRRTRRRRGRWHHDRGPAARPAGGPGGHPLPGGDHSDPLHSTLLPGGQHRPGLAHLPEQQHAVP